MVRGLGEEEVSSVARKESEPGPAPIMKKSGGCVLAVVLADEFIRRSLVGGRGR